MLILTRIVGESIKIGDDITVTVLGVNGKQVRLGIDAPKGVPVHREEIYKRIQVQKIGSLTAPTGEPTRDWTEQEQRTFISALHQVAIEESRL